MLEVLVRGEKVTVTDEQVKQFKELAFGIAEPYFKLINDPTIRDFAKAMWEKAPDYFFVIPASSSGKYHAEWSTDLGGLVRHVLMGVQAAYDLSFTFGLTDKETDIALAAMFGHDILKYGIDYDPRYMDMHPFLPRSYYGYKYSEGYLGDKFDTTSEEFDAIMTAIERHMGNIAEGAWTSVGGVKPETPLQYVVHIADYIASRKKFVMTDYVSGFDYWRVLS
jgi:hypothetical protein